MTEDKFIAILQKLYVRSKITKEDNIIKMLYNDNVYSISVERFNDLINRNNAKQIDGTILFDKNSYDVLVSYESVIRRIMIRVSENGELVKMKDTNNGIEYSIVKASDEYILFLIETLYDKNLISDFRRRNIAFHSVDNEHLVDIIQFLRASFRRIYTLQVISENNKSINDFKKLSNAAIFHIAYNLDCSFVEIKSFEEYFNIERMHGINRFDSREVEPPRRIYNPDLVYHYQMAVSTDSSFLQYIAYYHIIEYFLEKVYNEELIKMVQAQVTHPNFSIKREGDVKKIISLINKKLQTRKEEVVINEREAVKLTLSKYVDINNLATNLDSLDPTLKKYYKENEVEFSKGRKINFENSKKEEIVQEISHRIYETRNAIVHSKENESSKFIPFKHDKCLMREIPLIRFVSEEIILNNSELL